MSLTLIVITLRDVILYAVLEKVVSVYLFDVLVCMMPLTHFHYPVCRYSLCCPGQNGFHFPSVLQRNELVKKTKTGFSSITAMSNFKDAIKVSNLRSLV